MPARSQVTAAIERETDSIEGVADSIKAKGPRVRPFDQNRIGAGNGTRTRDIDLGKVALYQLSYSRAKLLNNERRTLATGRVAVKQGS